MKKEDLTRKFTHEREKPEGIPPEKRVGIKEGKFMKGGVNHAPSTKRPCCPNGQTAPKKQQAPKKPKPHGIRLIKEGVTKPLPASNIDDLEVITSGKVRDRDRKTIEECLMETIETQKAAINSLKYRIKELETQRSDILDSDKATKIINLENTTLKFMNSAYEEENRILSKKVKRLTHILKAVKFARIFLLTSLPKYYKTILEKV